MTAAGQASVSVAASLEKVFAVVSDVERTPEWSPECVGVEWVGEPADALPGAQFRGTNRRGKQEWTMDAVVDQFAPPHRFSFRTERDGSPRTRWTYELEPEDEGTRLSERWERLFEPPAIARLLERVVLRGGRAAHNQRNLEASLARIKAICER